MISSCTRYVYADDYNSYRPSGHIYGGHSATQAHYGHPGSSHARATRQISPNSIPVYNKRGRIHHYIYRSPNRAYHHHRHHRRIIVRY